MKAFITGSQAYGSPGPVSDVDLVIRCDEETRALLVKEFDPPTPRDAFDDGERDVAYGEIAQLKIDGLNLIICTTDERYESWRSGTVALKAMKPVTREQAVAVFKALFAVEESGR